MKRFLIATLAAAALAAVLPARAAPVLSLVSSSPSVSLNGDFTVDLVISGLTTGTTNQIVSGFSLEVFFDSNVLNASSLTTSFTPWGTGDDVFLEQAFFSNSVLFRLAALQNDDFLDALQGDSFVLSTINFRGLTDGFSNITYGTGSEQRNVVGREALSLNPLTVLGTCVAVGTGSCVQTVPEPATALLALLALAGAGLASRRPRPAMTPALGH